MTRPALQQQNIRYFTLPRMIPLPIVTGITDNTVIGFSPDIHGAAATTIEVDRINASQPPHGLLQLRNAHTRRLGSPPIYHQQHDRAIRFSAHRCTGMPVTAKSILSNGLIHT